MKRLFVENLDLHATEDELRQLFAAHVPVDQVSIVKDSYSGQSVSLHEWDQGSVSRASGNAFGWSMELSRLIRNRWSEPRSTFAFLSGRKDCLNKQSASNPVAVPSGQRRRLCSPEAPTNLARNGLSLMRRKREDQMQLHFGCTEYASRGHESADM